jgi:adenylate cyclase
VETYAHADALMALAIEQGFVLRLEQGRILWGCALAMQGDVAEGMAQLRQGLAAHQDIGPKVGQPYRLSLLAEAYGQAGHPEVGLQVLTEALTLVAETEERW